VATIQQIAIWGAGGHAKIVADTIRRGGQFEVAGFIDDGNPDRAGTIFYGALLYASPRPLLDADVRLLAVAIGDNECRLTKAETGRQAGFVLPAVIDPTAIISDTARLGDGTLVVAGAIINADASIAECAIVNTGAIVEHDCRIEDGVHIAPGATLAGNVSVGSCTMIGAGSTVRNGVRIGRHSIIGVGSAVVGDIPDHVVAFGVPARVVRKIAE